MSERTVRVGLIGCGNIGAGGHLPAYAHIPEAELVAVCDGVEELAHAAAERSGATAYTDYRRLLEREDIEMVDLCIPTYLHAQLAVEAMQTGKHVLCEKPMAHTLSAADAMIETARKTGVKLMIGQVRRFDHRYTSIREQLDAGRVGRPVFVRRAERQFLPFPPDIGGGVGFAETSWAYPQGFGGALYAQLDVVGTEGKIQYADKDTNPMLTYTTERGHELPRYFRFMSTTEYAFEEEIRHFVRCILDDREPAISPQDARAALEMALAAQRSAETGEPVHLPLQKGVK